MWFSHELLAQEVALDSLSNADTIKVKPKRKGKSFFTFLDFKSDYPNPKKAVLLSLIPGGGQIYNKKHAWIKLPVIYGGMIGMGYWAVYQKGQYNLYNDAYIAELNGEEHEFTGRASAATLKGNRDISDKNYQSTLLGMGALYLAGLLEAYVTAHLLDFNVSDDLSMGSKLKLTPSFSNSNLQIGLVYSLN